MPNSTDPIVVLVPDALGETSLAELPHVRPVRYRLGEEPTDEQRDARVLVVGVASPDETATLMAALPRLELVQTLSAGYDQWLDRLPPGVRLSNGRGAHGRSTAEWVVAALLAHVRDLAAFAAAQTEGRWVRHFARTLDGTRVTVLGAGDIANHVRSMLVPFGAEVTLVGRSARDGVLDMDGFRRIQAEQDVIVVAVPVSDATTGMVDTDFLAAMKNDAILINVGRGVLVDTEALMAATATGRIHAILDVTEPEPLPAGHPMWTTPGITITPHIGGAVDGVWERAWAVAAAQLAAYARGERPPNLVIEPA